MRAPGRGLISMQQTPSHRHGSRLTTRISSGGGGGGGSIGSDRTFKALIVLAIAGFWAGSTFRTAKEQALEELARVHDRVQHAAVKKDAAAAALEAARETVLASQADLLKVHSQHLRYSEDGMIQTHHELTTMPAWTESKPVLARVCAAPSGSPHRPGNLPIFVFICGVEGAGHHAMEAVLGDLSKKVDLVYTGYTPGLHSFAKHPNVSRAYQYPNISLANYEATVKRHLAGSKLKGRPLIFDSRDSYPEGFGCGSLAHPDLVYLAQLDGIVFDLRVLVVVRDPVAAVLSSVRRFNVKEFTYKNYQFQARAVQEGLTMINNGLAAVPCGKAYVLPYDDMLQDPAPYASPLGRLFSVDPSDLEASMTRQLKAPKPKPMAGDRAEMKQHLQDFFDEQKFMWPILSGSSPLPPINVVETIVGPPPDGIDTHEGQSMGHSMTASHGKDEASASKPPPPPPKKVTSAVSTTPHPTKYLVITWYTNLGFNNMRFILETALYLAHLLDRTLIVPPRLRMRTCVDDALCDASGCVKQQDDHYWCPLTSFLSWSELSRAGAVNPKDLKALLAGKSRHNADGAFADMFSKATLYIDAIADLPPDVRRSLNATGHYEGNDPLTFDYHRFHLGCELSYFKVQKQRWNGTKPEDKALAIRGLVEDYGGVTEDVLHLKGTPHNIGLTPTFWATRQGLDDSRQVWESGVRYHPAADKMAAFVADQLHASSSSFMCVHFRRGDFVTAGWLGKAKDLALVRANIERHRAGDSEPVYMATDERNASVLASFRAMGVKTYADVRADVERNASKRWRPMLAFEDYVGIVEQLVCSRARLFIGSKCSSYSGGIWNLRRRRLNDTSLHFTADTPPKDKPSKGMRKAKGM
eukprot:m.72421 g.72421  ORF g.72421 m.72421 type:complete len:867 (+) comp8782_c1_seq1:216-2816(+)